MSTEQKILTLGNKSEEMRIKAMRDKLLRMQEKLTDNAVALAGQNKDVRAILEAIKMLEELLISNKSKGGK